MQKAECSSLQRLNLLANKSIRVFFYTLNWKVKMSYWSIVFLSQQHIQASFFLSSNVWFKLVPRIMSELSAALTQSLQSVKQQFLVIPDWPEVLSQSEARLRLSDQWELSWRSLIVYVLRLPASHRMVSNISLTTVRIVTPPPGHFRLHTSHHHSVNGLWKIQATVLKWIPVWWVKR